MESQQIEKQTGESNNANTGTGKGTPNGSVLNLAPLRTLISVAFQFIPIWIMVLIHSVSDKQFEFTDYIGTVLVFDIVACATGISEILRRLELQRKTFLTTILSFALPLILCLSSIIYSLLLVDKIVRQTAILVMAIIFTGLMVVINIILDRVSSKVSSNVHGGVRHGTR